MPDLSLLDFIKQAFEFIKTNAIASLSLFVSFLVWLQHRKDNDLARETAVMSVKPHLSLNTNRSPSEGIYEASIHNNGIGPALIKSFTVYIDGQEAIANGHIRPFENAVLQLRLATNRHFTSTLVEGAGLSAGEVEKIFSIELHLDNLPPTERILDEIQRLSLRIEYTDLYGNAMPAYDSRENGEGF